MEITVTSEITVTPIQSMGGDQMVVAAARVSTSGSEAAKWADPAYAEESAGLINYLMRHRHGTPFEHAAMTFFCHAPLFVWQEWTRHRIGFSYNGESGRYRLFEPLFWVPRRDRPMVVPPNHRPARPKYLPLESDAAYERMLSRSREVYTAAYRAYREEVDEGIAPEVARRHLPTATYASYWVTCNPRSLMHFLSLRTHEPEAAFVSYPQAEIEEAARIAETFLAEGWPKTYAAWVKHGRVAP